MDEGFPIGGSRLLAKLIDEHGEAILADLLHYYRVDLRDLFSETNPLSPRYVLALIVNMPEDSAFAASKSGGAEYRGWDSAQYTRAALVNAVNTSNYLTIMVNRDPKKAAPNPPDPFPTPGSTHRTKSHAPNSFAAIAASMIAAQKKKKEAANAGRYRH